MLAFALFTLAPSSHFICCYAQLEPQDLQWAPGYTGEGALGYAPLIYWPSMVSREPLQLD